MKSLDDIKTHILSTVCEIAADTSEMPITFETPLVGSQKCLDSMGLVELCVRLEDYAIAQGGNFDWTSEDSMSTRRGMFRSITSLSEELFRQLNPS